MKLTSQNVFPRHLADCVANGHSVNPKNCRDLLAVKTKLFLASGVLHLVRIEFRLWKLVSTRIPMFLPHIFPILLERAGKKMIGIATSWIVARVANAVAFWNRTLGYLIRDPVSEKPLFIYEDKSVTGRDSTSPPRPAVVRFANRNSAPEPFFPRDVSVALSPIFVRCFMVMLHIWYYT